MANKIYNDLRNDLISIALTEFCENGYEKTSINTLVEKAGVSKGAFYHYFKSKEAILDAIIDQHREICEQVAAGVDKAVSPRKQLTYLLTNFNNYKLISSHFEESRPLIEALSLPANIELKTKLRNAFRRTPENALTEIIEAGSAKGEFSPSSNSKTIAEQILMLGELLYEQFSDYMLSDQKNKGLWDQQCAAYSSAVNRLLGLQENELPVIM